MGSSLLRQIFIGMLFLSQTAVARNYDPQIGRFLQEDPAEGRLERPMTHINKYVYVMNNPINYIDPDGAEATIPFYGNFCGQGVGGGEPIDELDEACRRHDEETRVSGSPGAAAIDRGQADLKSSARIAGRSVPQATWRFISNPLNPKIMFRASKQLTGSILLGTGGLILGTGQIVYGNFQQSDFAGKVVIGFVAVPLLPAYVTTALGVGITSIAFGAVDKFTRKLGF